jgi:hypothetical protein
MSTHAFTPKAGRPCALTEQHAVLEPKSARHRLVVFFAIRTALIVHQERVVDRVLTRAAAAQLCRGKVATHEMEMNSCTSKDWEDAAAPESFHTPTQRFVSRQI